MTKEQLEDKEAERMLVETCENHHGTGFNSEDIPELIRLARVGLSLEAYQERQKARGKFIMLMNIDEDV